MSSREDNSRPEWARVQTGLCAARGSRDQVLAAVREHAVDAHLAQRTNHRGRDLDAQDILGIGAVERPLGRVPHAIPGDHIHMHDVLVASDRVTLRQGIESDSNYRQPSSSATLVSVVTGTLPHVLDLHPHDLIDRPRKGEQQARPVLLQRRSVSHQASPAQNHRHFVGLTT